MSGGIVWFEHMYQPSWNFYSYNSADKGSWDPKRMINDCYAPNLEFMKECKVKINMNITQTMFDFFRLNNSLKILEGYKKLGKQIEYVGSTAHHILAIQKYAPVLKDEIMMQERFIKHYFNQNPKTFFPPEMAVDETTLPLLKSMGYKGVVLSGGLPNFLSYDTTGVFESDIRVFPHNNLLSSQFSFPSKNDIGLVLDKMDSYNEPATFAFDHESFGGYFNPHVLELKKQFFSAARERGWKFLQFKDLMKKKTYGYVNIKPTTWVGDYGKWEVLKDRIEAIDYALKNLNSDNQFYLRKWVLPSCHLHIDYATELFWDYCREAGVDKVRA